MSPETITLLEKNLGGNDDDLDNGRKKIKQDDNAEEEEQQQGRRHEGKRMSGHYFAPRERKHTALPLVGWHTML